MRNTALIILLLLLGACANQLTGPMPRRVVAVSGSQSLKDINPGDIETIEIVKGPSASAIYGATRCQAIVVIVPRHPDARQQSRD
jgi:outer membrane receptor protein involved in Fe transport